MRKKKDNEQLKNNNCLTYNSYYGTAEFLVSYNINDRNS